MLEEGPEGVRGLPSDTSEQREMILKIYNNRGGMGIKPFKRIQWP